MNKNIIIGLLGIILIIILVNVFYKEPQSIIGNEEVLAEIDRLLVPLSQEAITKNDFDTLSELTKNDEYTKQEVKELAALAKYEEYSHIGHGLTSLHDYIKTGEEEICPGHSLAHYYIFIRHVEERRAE